MSKVPVNVTLLNDVLEKLHTDTSAVNSVFNLQALGVGVEALKPVELNKTEPEKQKSAINWLIGICSGLVDTVRAQAIRLDKLEEAKAKLVEDVKELEEEKEKLATEVKVVEEKVEVKMVHLEEDTDDVRQRSMQGCITVSSPNTNTTQSLFTNRPKDDGSGVGRNESDLEMVLRAVEAKARVQFDEREVVDFYPLEQGQHNRRPTKWFIRFNTLRPESHWQALAAGMRTGQGLTSANVYLNHLLTPRRAKFVREVVKVAHKERRLGKYMVDQRGNTWVKQVKGGLYDRGDQYKYWLVTNKEEVEKVEKGDFSYFINKKNKKN